MKKDMRLKIVYVVITAMSLIAAVSNILHFAYLDPQTTDHSFWEKNTDGPGFVVRDVLEDGVTAAAGIQVGDILLSLDGQTFETSSEAHRYLNQKNPGESILYELQRDGETSEARVVLAQRAKVVPAISFFIGLLFIVVGFLAVYRKPWLTTPRLFYFFSWTFFVMLSFNNWSANQPGANLVRYFHIAGILLWGPSMVHFFMNFPIRMPLLIKHPKAVYLFYLPALLGLGYVIFFNPGLGFLANVIIGAYFAASFYLMDFNAAKVKNPHEQKSLRVIRYGMYFGFVPLGLLAFFPQFLIQLLGRTVLAVVYCLLGLVPISFGYSIMRYGLMDVEIIVKKSLVYSLLTSSFLLLYFLVVLGLGGYLAEAFGFSGQGANLIFLVLVALAFQPVRNWIQGFVDRRFFRERHEYQKTLLKLSQELPGVTSEEEILKNVVNTISSAMNVTEVSINLYDQNSNRYLTQVNCGGHEKPDIPWQEGTDTLVNILKREKSCCLFYKIEEDETYNALSISEKVRIEKAGIVLSVPMFYQDALVGMINLGPKASGQVYNQEDMDLLQTVSGNTAISLINARLHQEDLNKQKLENEMTLARKIQEGLLPKSDPELPGYELTGVSMSSSLVGGDYFDYFPIGDDRFLFLIGDVSGKGMPAAIYMSKVQGMIQMAINSQQSPREILMDVNRQIYGRLDRQAFITMTIGVLDMANESIIFSRAGHVPLLFKHKKKASYLESSGMGLGLTDGELFNSLLEESSINIKPGDVCILYSDGVTEAMNPQNETYGEDRFRKLVQSFNGKKAGDLKDRLLQEIHEFRAGAAQNDDITLVILRRE